MTVQATPSLSNSHESAAAEPEAAGPAKALAGLVADYAVDKIGSFGKEEWMRYYGVDPGPAPELPGEFYKWWRSPDVVEPGKLNCDTHLPPVLRPQYVRKAALKIPLTLETLGYLAKHPKEGPSSQYALNSVLQQHGDTKAGPACWLVLRKDVFARDESDDGQREYIRKLNAIGANYDEMPSGLDLITVLFATHVHTGGDRYLSNGTGKERCWTFSRCKERVQVKESSHYVFIGGFSPGALFLRNDHRSNDVNYGVAALRKF